MKAYTELCGVSEEIRHEIKAIAAKALSTWDDISIIDRNKMALELKNTQNTRVLYIGAISGDIMSLCDHYIEGEELSAILLKDISQNTFVKEGVCIDRILIHSDSIRIDLKSTTERYVSNLEDLIERIEKIALTSKSETMEIKMHIVNSDIEFINRELYRRLNSIGGISVTRMGISITPETDGDLYSTLTLNISNRRSSPNLVVYGLK